MCRSNVAQIGGEGCTGHGASGTMSADDTSGVGAQCRLDILGAKYKNRADDVTHPKKFSTNLTNSEEMRFKIRR